MPQRELRTWKLTIEFASHLEDSIIKDIADFVADKITRRFRSKVIMYSITPGDDIQKSLFESHRPINTYNEPQTSQDNP